MPRMTIRRNGATVRATYPEALTTYVNSDINERLIWETAHGDAELHNTDDARGAPADAIGYIHNYAENVLLAVSRLDTDRYTIELCGRAGRVNGGQHVF